MSATFSQTSPDSTCTPTPYSPIRHLLANRLAQPKPYLYLFRSQNHYKIGPLTA